ncbi:HPr family phosphocarrier protein [Acidocella sp.]|uniref:HPr family phosphocarrier protein n=1 Tax=Acidocella sp. TaxID=50710 RepID=UPI002639C70B|nr:HPr family phosphocarrier protein [Acidocella sp.]
MDGLPTGLLLVSHSLALAQATEALVRQMTGARLPIALAAGAGPDKAELGTDSLAILEAGEALCACGQIVVLMDIGSAVLSAEMALDLAEEPLKSKLHLAAAPFVEGALAAGVAASAGLPVAAVLAEAAAGLRPKLSALGGQAQNAVPAIQASLTRAVTLGDPNGLHLRPAARCVAIAAGFDATLRLACKGRVAGLESLTGLMALGAKGGDVVTIEASGPQAAQAAEALAAILAEVPAAQPHEPAPQTGAGPVPISPGRVAGRLVVAARHLPPIPDTPDEAPEGGWATLQAAIARVRAHLGEGLILGAQAALLTDPAILAPAKAGIFEHGLHPAAAWHRAIAQAAAGYEALEDAYLRARGRDVREMGDEVLRVLLGGGGLAWPTEPCVLLVEDLSAAEAAALPPEILGVLDRRGGRTSHAAILLRAAGVPCLGGVTFAAPPEAVAFDGATGDLIADPDVQTRAAFAPPRAASAGPASIALPDGTGLEFWANVAGAADAALAARSGAHGIGLARTEMLFLDRLDCPTEEEQAARIGAMLAPFKGRPVTVRLLDAGADKPVPFLHLAPEENPALGVRGVRALLKHPEFCATHLRAVLRAGAAHDLRVMVPMITFPEEMRTLRQWLETACRETGLPCPPLGAMVEVPAAALAIPDLVPVCDFFSIGTNDLTQYTLAAERGNQELAAFADPANEVVIGLCARVVRHAAGRPVSVCGEAAGDERAARKLVAAGIRKLSMGAARLGPIRALWQ